MKKFEKPVVVLNEMLMNESIATDCCYGLVQEGLVTTLVPYNGGTIGSTPATYKVRDVVIQLLGGYATLPCNHYKLFVPNANAGSGASYTVGAVPVSDGSGGYSSYWVVHFDQMISTATPNKLGDVSNVCYLDGGSIRYAFNNNTSPDLLEWNSGAYIQLVMSGCNHMTPACPWVQTIGGKDNMHIGSLVPHALGMPDWAAPHAAARYNS